MKLQEVAEKYIPRFVSGLMTRDYEKVRGALLITASEYHEINDVALHPALRTMPFIKSPESQAIVSAILWGIDRDNNGAAI